MSDDEDSDQDGEREEGRDRETIAKEIFDRGDDEDERPPVQEEPAAKDAQQEFGDIDISEAEESGASSSSLRVLHCLGDGGLQPCSIPLCLQQIRSTRLVGYPRLIAIFFFPSRSSNSFVYKLYNESFNAEFSILRINFHLLASSDVDDFIVDDDGQPISKTKKKKHIIHDDA